MDPVPFYVAGRPAHGDEAVTIRHPHDGQVAGRTSHANPDQVEAAAAAAEAVRAEAAALPAHRRADALQHVADRLAARADELAQLITAERGKPVKWSRLEVRHAISTFRSAAGEARRFSGGLQRLDTDPGSAGRLALIRRAPRGPVLGIAPVDFPLSAAARKVAPALAVGAPVVLRPASATPLSALALGELVAGAGLPPGVFSVLPLPDERAEALVRDPRLPVVSFTGPGSVGAAIRRTAPDKHVTLELGGDAAAVICEDWNGDEDLSHAARRIATATCQAGQSCVAVRRVFVHEWLYDAFLPRLLAALGELRQGDPTEETTDIGPMASEEAARRVERWVDAAVADGASLQLGGRREGLWYPPTVLTGGPAVAKAAAEGVTGPVLVVEQAPGDEAAFAAVNGWPYGVGAGMFTHRLDTAFAAHWALEAGAVVVGDVPAHRADPMAYGGVGRAGVRGAMDDYTEERVLVMTGVAL